MKEGIHPKYYEIEARCACGATWQTRSTKPELHLEICNNCHPFFTGRQKLVDTEGRVERFTKRFGAQTSESRKQAAQAAKAKKTPAGSRQVVLGSSGQPQNSGELSRSLVIFRSSRASRWRSPSFRGCAGRRLADLFQREHRQLARRHDNRLVAVLVMDRQRLGGELP